MCTWEKLSFRTRVNIVKKQTQKTEVKWEIKRYETMCFNQDLNPVLLSEGLKFNPSSHSGLKRNDGPGSTLTMML